MRKLALALAAAAALGFAAPSLVTEAAAAPDRIQVAQATTVKKTTVRRGGGKVVKRTVVRRGVRRPGRVVSRTVVRRPGRTVRTVVKRRPGGTVVVKKRVIRR